MKHRNIIDLRAIIDDAQDDKVYLVMEYAEFGQIMSYEDDKFSPTRSGSIMLSESEIRQYSRQLVAALKYLHEKKIMHLDLKP